MTKIESATQWMEQIAADNSHGYSQQTRWGPDYDCSSMVISAWEQAGVPVKTKGATYTGNMYSVFKSCGFSDVTSSINLASGGGVVRGDVLLNVSNHTAMSIGNGRIVHARSSEGNSISGDQSGNEIRTQSYWNYPWDYVLRYTGGGEASAPTVNSNVSTKTCTVTVAKLSQGSEGEYVKNLQLLLIGQGFSCGSAGADGEFGNGTLQAVKQFQSSRSLLADGIVGANTWKALLSD